MKNIIKEELGYMKYLLGYKRGIVISEQEIGEQVRISKKERNVLVAYKQIVDGSSIMGTEPQKIVDGFNMIKDLKEFNRLLTLFKDKKTGYPTFTEMIRGEFESDNQDDLNKIIKKLNDLTFNISKNTAPDKFPKLKFTPSTTPLTDAPPAAATTTPTESENKEHWEDVVKYYKNNKSPKWKFRKMGSENYLEVNYEKIFVDSTDTNDSNSFLVIYDDGEVYISNRGVGEEQINARWEWDGTKPVIKFKDITKKASGYVQPTDLDWSAVTDNNKVIGLNAKGYLVKRVQHLLLNIGYSGTTGSPITTDVVGCKTDSEKCDGIYGKSTKEMVKQFQKDNFLSVDGIVGKQTYDALL